MAPRKKRPRGRAGISHAHETRAPAMVALPESGRPEPATVRATAPGQEAERASTRTRAPGAGTEERGRGDEAPSAARPRGRRPEEPVTKREVVPRSAVL